MQIFLLTSQVDESIELGSEAFDDSVADAFISASNDSDFLCHVFLNLLILKSKKAIA